MLARHAFQLAAAHASQRPPEDHWSFLEEIDAPRWVDLALEATLEGTEGDDPWFHHSHWHHETPLVHLVDLVAGDHGAYNFQQAQTKKPVLLSACAKSPSEKHRGEVWELPVSANGQAWPRSQAKRVQPPCLIPQDEEDHERSCSTHESAVVESSALKCRDEDKRERTYSGISGILTSHSEKSERTSSLSDEVNLPEISLESVGSSASLAQVRKKYFSSLESDDEVSGRGCEDSDINQAGASICLGDGGMDTFPRSCTPIASVPTLEEPTIGPELIRDEELPFARKLIPDWSAQISIALKQSAMNRLRKSWGGALRVKQDKTIGPLPADADQETRSSERGLVVGNVFEKTYQDDSFDDVSDVAPSDLTLQREGCNSGASTNEPCSLDPPTRHRMSKQEKDMLENQESFSECSLVCNTSSSGLSLSADSSKLVNPGETGLAMHSKPGSWTKNSCSAVRSTTLKQSAIERLRMSWGGALRVEQDGAIEIPSDDDFECVPPGSFGMAGQRERSNSGARQDESFETITSSRHRMSKLDRDTAISQETVSEGSVVCDSSPWTSLSADGTNFVNPAVKGSDSHFQLDDWAEEFCRPMKQSTTNRLRKSWGGALRVKQDESLEIQREDNLELGSSDVTPQKKGCKSGARKPQPCNLDASSRHSHSKEEQNIPGSHQSPAEDSTLCASSLCTSNSAESTKIVNPPESCSSVHSRRTTGSEDAFTAARSTALKHGTMNRSHRSWGGALRVTQDVIISSSTVEAGENSKSKEGGLLFESVRLQSVENSELANTESSGIMPQEGSVSGTRKDEPTIWNTSSPNASNQDKDISASQQSCSGDSPVCIGPALCPPLPANSPELVNAADKVCCAEKNCAAVSGVQVKKPGTKAQTGPPTKVGGRGCKTRPAKGNKENLSLESESKAVVHVSSKSRPAMDKPKQHQKEVLRMSMPAFQPAEAIRRSIKVPGSELVGRRSAISGDHTKIRHDLGLRGPCKTGQSHHHNAPPPRQVGSGSNGQAIFRRSMSASSVDFSRKAGSGGNKIMKMSSSSGLRTSMSQEKGNGLAELIAEHNRKVRPVPQYEPRLHSLRDIREWERRTGKKYYSLPAAERVKVNQELSALKEETGSKSQTRM